MHIHFIEDKDGQTVDVVPFCCDSCHRDWCLDNGLKYDGWNGCNSGGDSQQFCASCGVYCGGGSCENKPCDCQVRNIVVNRFSSDEGEKCPCGNWIQIPSSMLERFKP